MANLKHVQILSLAAIALGISCGGQAPQRDTREDTVAIRPPLIDDDDLITPAWVLQPSVADAFTGAFGIAKSAAPVIKGVIDFLSGAPSTADLIDAAETAIVNQIEANQGQDLGGHVQNDLQMFKFIARNPCNAVALEEFGTVLFDTGYAFNTLRLVMEGPNVQQAYALASDFNVIGQLYLMLLKGSPVIGSPACGLTEAPNGIAPFDSVSFNEVLAELKQTNYDLIGAQEAYLTNNMATASMTTFRTSKIYSSSMFAKNPNLEFCTANGLAVLCNASTQSCSCFSGGSHYCDTSICLRTVTAAVDAAFMADPTINAIQAFQEQVIGEFPDAINGVIPVVPVPSFYEIPVAVVPNAPNGFDVFYKSASTGLVHVAGTNGSGAFIEQSNLGANLVGKPAAQITPTTLEVYAVGTDNKVCHKTGPRTTTSNSISDWSYLCDVAGPTITDSPATPPFPIVDQGRTVFANDRSSRFMAETLGAAAPAAASWGSSALFGSEISRTTPVVVGLNGGTAAEIFTLGIDGTVKNALWLPPFGMFDLGHVDRSQVVGAPSVVSWGDGRWDLFAIGRDQGVWHLGFSATATPCLLGYQSLGGIGIGKPSGVAAFGAGRLDVFVIGTDHALYQAYCSGANCDNQGSFWGYYRLGATPFGIIGNPIAVSPGYNQIDIVVQDATGFLYHQSWDGTTWSGFLPLGDIPAAYN